jgi:hypothetical protein
MFELLVVLSAMSPVQVTLYWGPSAPTTSYNVFGHYKSTATPRAVFTTRTTVVIVSK